jgi:uncharacterized membrane protein YbhN (UPF0104 family)
LLLSPRKLPLVAAVLVQTSGLFVNKILPAGSGALGVSYLFLRANKVDKTSSALVVVLNNVFGFVGHGLLLAAVLLLSVDMPRPNLGHVHISGALLWLPAVVLVAALVLLIVGMKRRQFAGQKFKKLRALLSRPVSLLAALAISMLLTACYVSSLYAAAASVGVSLQLPVVVIALTISVLATVVIPVPGGIGAAEAGVFVALRAYNLPPATALTVAFLYRLITFWLPLVAGAIAFVVVEKRKLIAHRV